jgi:hypothetical protein
VRRGRRHGVRAIRLRRAGALLLPLLLTSRSTGQLAAVEGLPPAIEYQIKASFVYTVAKFVEWPEGAFRDPAMPMTLGILGDDAASEAIADTLRGRKVHNRALVVKRLSDPGAARDCQILYVSSLEGRNLPALLSQVASQGILTVGEGSEFAASGGILGLTLRESLVQFEVNIAAAQRAGLAISSKILRLGRVVKSPAAPAEVRR